MKRFLNVLATMGFLAASVQAAITFSLEPPGVQERTGAPYETISFNTADLGAFPATNFALSLGTVSYSTGGVILGGLEAEATLSVPGDPLSSSHRFGGARDLTQVGDPPTRYISTGIQSPGSNEYTISLPGDTFYFGFFWGAGDPNNEVEFLYGGSTVALFTVFDIINHPDFVNQRFDTGVPPGHRGNPNYNPVLDAAEPFAFLNFNFTGGDKFDQIIIRNRNDIPGNIASGFETDNHTFSFTEIPDVPEPATFGLAGAALLALGLKLRKRS